MLLDIFASLDFGYSNLIFFQKIIWFQSMFWFYILLKYFFVLKKYNLFLNYIIFFFTLNFDSPKILIFQHSLMWILSISVLILLTKFWSLIPYIYGLSTNLVFGLSLGLSYWLCMYISSFFNKMKNFFSHFVAPGSPFFLALGLTYMDLMSWLVRPFTLTLRLVMKMSIGHMIFSSLGLILSNLFFSNYVSFFLILFMLLFFYFIEFFVSIIQSLVFGLLNMKYLGDHSL